jgi:DNA-binding NtrC family response regulator
MTAISVHRPLSPVARILLCTQQPAPLYELLAAADDPSLEIGSAEFDTANSATTAIERLSLRPFDVCLIDATWDGAAVAELVQRIQAAHRSTQVVRLTETAEELSVSGQEPVEVVSLVSPPAVVRRLLRSALQKAKLQSENRSLKRQLQARVVNEIVGQTETANLLRESVRAAADQDCCALFHGESGAGKQQAARVVHLASRRSLRPFLVIDCPVHSTESLERELLGEPAGPVDSAELEETGRLSSAAGGTIFLKNVETLPLAAQKKLASILARKSYSCPVTGKTRPLDVRVMASTDIDLAAAAQEGTFPVALYESLSACTIHVPALRERLQDIGLLTEHVLNHLAVVEGKPVKRLSVEALKALRSHDWPGNLRELQNVIERACSLDESPLLTADAIAPWIAKTEETDPQEPSGLSLREMERKLIETTFARCQGNREQTARLLKIGIRTLSGKLREYGYPPRGGPGSNRRLAKAA